MGEKLIKLLFIINLHRIMAEFVWHRGLVGRVHDGYRTSKGGSSWPVHSRRLQLVPHAYQWTASGSWRKRMFLMVCRSLTIASNASCETRDTFAHYPSRLCKTWIGLNTALPTPKEHWCSWKDRRQGVFISYAKDPPSCSQQIAMARRSF